MPQYTIGIDFGTLSVRALIADVADGKEVACATHTYIHAVMVDSLPDGTLLPVEWALQHPQDYIDGLRFVIRTVVNEAGISSDDVIGIGIDFTSSTSFPVDREYVPLCLKDSFASNPYAWPMLWKHHAAQKYADRMTELAQVRSEAFLERCGGRISSEMMFPRLWQIAVEAPEVYEAAFRFVEAGDWITYLLTGSTDVSVNPASYKLFWTEADGYPLKFLTALDQRLEKITEKLADSLLPLGSCAGFLNDYGAELTGLHKGTPVSVTCIDAHTALPAAGVAEAGKLLLILGTSAAHLVLSKEEHDVKGILCRAKDGIIPGWYAYEAGQSCCGDHFQWFITHCIPASYEFEAHKNGISIHQLLTEKASKLQPGESGLLALDWWNGNRSVLMDSQLSGFIIGLTLQTKPEEIYRALIEATAYGTRKIIENFEENGISIEEVYVCGGIAKKNVMLMQIYADVLKKKLKIVQSDQANALGTAILAAVAAGEKRGGYATIAHAAHQMGGASDKIYDPSNENSIVYDKLYAEYCLLHEYFGKENVALMHRMREFRHVEEKD